MKLASLYTQGSFYEVGEFAATDLPEKFHPIIEYGILASEKDLFDPIETELTKIGDLYLSHTQHLHSSWKTKKSILSLPKALRRQYWTFVMFRSQDGRKSLNR